MKYVALLALLISPLVLGEENHAPKFSFSFQRFSLEECRKQADEHNNDRKRKGFRKIGLIANKNVCLLVTLDGHAASEEAAIAKVEKELSRSTIWRLEREKGTYFWHLVSK